MRTTTSGVAVVVAILVCATAAGTTAQQPPLVPPALAQQAADRGSVRVIVEMDTPVIADALATPQRRVNQRAAIAAAQDSIVSRLPAAARARVRRFTTIPGFAVEVTPAGLAALARSPGVRRVVEDRLDPLMLATSVPQIRGTQAWSLGYDGSGWAVAVLDTGVESTHGFLSGKVVSEACYSGASNCPDGSTSQTGTGSGVPCTYSGVCDHGTHVAGIAAGSGDSFSRVARGAHIIAIQVFSRITTPSPCSPCSYASDQIKGLERVYELRNTFNIAAVNMSLGGGAFTSTCDADESLRKAAIDNLRAAGIATVIASGNSGFTNAISAPACISTAISVGSVSSTSNTVSSFSNSASFLTLLAPGAVINSSIVNNQFGFKQGTSMATPHVAGAWAVLKQRAPAASVTNVLAALQNSAAVTDSRNGISTPRIDVMTALTSSTLLPSFTDSPIAPGATIVKSVHVTELRDRINALRVAHGLSIQTWTDAPTPGATFIRAAHITDMRTALTQAFAAAGMPAPTFTDSSLSGVPVKAVHVTELRDAVIQLEPGT